MAQTKNFSIWIGDTFAKKFVFKSNNVPVNLSNVTINFKTYGAISNIDKNLTIDDVSSGEAILKLSVEETQKLSINTKISYTLSWLQDDTHVTFLSGKIITQGFK